MRIIFAGTPVTAVPPLEALIDSQHEVVAVITRPPARAGRGRKLVESPVAACATQHGLPVIEAANMRDDSVRSLIDSYQADLGVVVAYGALIPQVVLDMPTRGWVNLHFSDLPHWRGAAPVQHAIMAGETSTASSIFQLEAGLDTGPVFSRVPCDIAEDDTTDTLLERMSQTGAAQIIALLDDMTHDQAHAVPQNTGDDNEHVTHAPMLSPALGFIDFDRPAAVIDCHIRAYTSNPGAWTTLPDGARLKLSPVRRATDEETRACAAPASAPSGTVAASKKHVIVACTDGWLLLGQVAPAGKGWMDAAAWARGARLQATTRLGQPSTPQGEGN